MPEVFVTISPNLAARIGVKPGETVVVSSARGKIECKANVLPIVKPLKVGGSEVEVVGIPWHWGYQGMATGSSANELTPCVGDPNTMIPEYKAFLCNVSKA